MVVLVRVVGHNAGLGRRRQARMDIVEAPGQRATVPIDGATGEPSFARPSIPGHHPVMEGEAERGQPLVVDGDRGKPFQDVSQVVPEEADEPAEERRRLGRVRSRRVETGDEPPGHGERIPSGGRRLDHRDGIRGQVGPPRVPAWSCTLE